MNRLYLLCLAALALVGPASGPALAAGSSTADLFDNPLLMRGRGFEIRQSEVDDALTALRATLATQGQQLPRDEEPALRNRMLERMMLTRILSQRATDDDRKKARDLADKFINDTKSKAPSEESYRRQLLATGLKPEDFEKRAYEQALMETVIEREVKTKLMVPDRDIRDFYEVGDDNNTRELSTTIAKLEAAGNQDTVFYRDATNRFSIMRRSNLARLDRPETVKADLILLYTVDPGTRARLSEEAEKAKLRLATNTLARLRAGEDFAKVAREISDDPDVGRTGGEYVATKLTNMAPELMAALFIQPIGEIGGPIATRFGVYLARVKERQPAMKLPLTEVEKDIRELLLSQMVEKNLPEYSAQLKKEYGVEEFPPAAK